MPDMLPKEIRFSRQELETLISAAVGKQPDEKITIRWNSSGGCAVTLLTPGPASH